ncbi:CapA family protein [Candidatus Curtissbacteria bacterium]|nr:CapA family protein [Candidatus Collierbacteria bacterium]MBI3282917.1 CapA family protein [Candidatus Curtissbacteria bacterium]
MILKLLSLLLLLYIPFFIFSRLKLGKVLSSSTLSVEQIFSDDHSWTATLSAQRKRVIIATGDVLPARAINIKTIRFNNFNWPYEETADVLRSGDLTFINLETSLIKNCPQTSGGFKFCGDERNVSGLVFAGVDVANLANNHSGNYGLSGVDNTVNLLNSNGILVTGTNGPIYKESIGVKFAFLGYNDTGPNVNDKKMQTEIGEAQKNADIVIVAFHWGVEYVSQPNSRQKYLGRLAVDSGADLVIGNHPHWIQPVEIYKGKLINYALGNFVFDQMWSIKTRQGVVGKYTFYDNQLVDAEFLPVLIHDYGQPTFLSNSQKKKVLDEMKAESVKLIREFHQN